MRVPVDRYLDKHYLPLHEWNESQDVLPKQRFIRFVADVARSEGLENLAWDACVFAHTLRPSFSYSVGGAPTLNVALRSAIQRTRTHSSVRIELLETANSVFVHRTPDFSEDDHGPQMGWGAFAILVGVVRQYAGERWSPPVLSVPSSALRGAWPRGEFGNSRKARSEGAWWFEIPRRDLSRPPLQNAAKADPGGNGRFASLPERDAPYGQVLSGVVRSYLPSGSPTLEFIAEVVETSPTTLKRRLRRIGRTYSEVLEEARFAKARESLESTDAKITDIAHETGYQSPSNFSRAFRRVAGVSPRQFRAMHRSSL